MPSKNEMAAVLTRSEAMRAGVATFDDPSQVGKMVAGNSRKLYGFTRKQLPPGLPVTPYKYIYSVSGYGELVNLGVGFPKFLVVGVEDENEQHGPPCQIQALYFIEEAVVDKTEFGPHTSAQIVDSIMQTGPGMNASNDRRKMGWFVSDNCPPRQEEVDRAVTLYTQECRRLLTEGNAFFAANKHLEISELHRRAAHYLKQRVPWDHGRTNKMVDCIGCQEPIRDNSIVHAPPQGCGAVQPGRWPDAIIWGLKKMEDVPERFKTDVEEALVADAASTAAIREEKEEQEETAENALEDGPKKGRKRTQ